LGDLDVFHDGNKYFVADGFHRTVAAARVKRASVPCRIHKGTARDALLFGMTANDRHGLRPTREDKRWCVLWLLDNGGKMTQVEIAKTAGVSERTVRHIVAERRDQNRQVAGSDSQSAESGDPDPFALHDGESDPFGELEAQPEPERRTEPAGTDAFEEPPPRTPGKGTEAPGGVEKTPAELFQIQRSKTVKTAEALMRAFDDLKALRYSKQHQPAIADCKALLQRAKTW